MDPGGAENRVGEKPSSLQKCGAAQRRNKRVCGLLPKHHRILERYMMCGPVGSCSPDGIPGGRRFLPLGFLPFSGMFMCTSEPTSRRGTSDATVAGMEICLPRIRSSFPDADETDANFLRGRSSFGARHNLRSAPKSAAAVALQGAAHTRVSQEMRHTAKSASITLGCPQPLANSASSQRATRASPEGCPWMERRMERRMGIHPSTRRQVEGASFGQRGRRIRILGWHLFTSSCTELPGVNEGGTFSPGSSVQP